MLCKINPSRYPDFIAAAETHDCGKVYPLSIAEGIQNGDIFTGSLKNDTPALFWAHCGFAYLSGKVDACVLADIYELMLDKAKSGSRRFLLMTNDESICEYFHSKDDVILEKRYLFKYQKNSKILDSVVLPVGYELREIDNRLLDKIAGDITPALFWKEVNNFLAKGKGYCIIHNRHIASWAFSAAVSSKEIDIGIETNPKYKHQGLGLMVAQKMIQYTLDQDKTPVWACHYKNLASKRMAEKLGFEKNSECHIIKYRH